jgi:hypothetical protein
MSDVTRILDRAGKGDGAAAEELLPLVYEELRKLATARMAQESAGQTLQPTALVHEAWLRLTGGDDQHWNKPGTFFRSRRRGHAAHPHSGGRYNPATDSWKPVSTIGIPAARMFHTAVWTGSEILGDQ